MWKANCPRQVRKFSNPLSETRPQGSDFTDSATSLRSRPLSLCHRRQTGPLHVAVVDLRHVLVEVELGVVLRYRGTSCTPPDTALTTCVWSPSSFTVAAVDRLGRGHPLHHLQSGELVVGLRLPRAHQRQELLVVRLGAAWPVPGPWQFSQPTCLQVRRLLGVLVAADVLEPDGVADHALAVELPVRRPLGVLHQRVVGVAVLGLSSLLGLARVARLARLRPDEGRFASGNWIWDGCWLRPLAELRQVVLVLDLQRVLLQELEHLVVLHRHRSSGVRYSSPSGTI